MLQFAVAFTLEELKHLAHLARLKISENDLAGMADDLNRVMDSFKELQELDLGAVEITAHSVDTHSVWRDDVVVPPFSRNELLAGAPKTEAGLFIVPSILD